MSSDLPLATGVPRQDTNIAAIGAQSDHVLCIELATIPNVLKQVAWMEDVERVERESDHSAVKDV